MSREQACRARLAISTWFAIVLGTPMLGTLIYKLPIKTWMLDLGYGALVLELLLLTWVNVRESGRIKLHHVVTFLLLTGVIGLLTVGIDHLATKGYSCVRSTITASR
jgi:hypothetical protein